LEKEEKAPGQGLRILRDSGKISGVGDKRCRLQKKKKKANASRERFIKKPHGRTASEKKKLSLQKRKRWRRWVWTFERRKGIQGHSGGEEAVMEVGCKGKGWGGGKEAL